jgi:hypothetical protein
MTLPVSHPLKEYHLNVYISSIGATPTVGYVAVPKKGRIVGIKAVQSAAVTGTSAVAVAVNGGTALSSLALSITGGSAGTEFSATANSTDASDVSEDDVISLTPSGATGASIAGYFTLVIRT